jgi:predicted PurR-regulated permease PerM
MVAPISRSKETLKLRALTKRERRLAVLFVLALFAMANFYGLSYIFELASDSSRAVADLWSQEQSNGIWLREKDLWLKRKLWIDKTQPRIQPNQAPQSDLLESLTASAKSNQLQIVEQSFGEIQSKPNYQSVSVRFKLGGPLQNVVKWLVQVQQPELFQAITSFSLKSGNEPPTVNLELEIARWYAPKS